jgi:hypothetical protein
MIRIPDQQGVVIEEDRACFVEGNLMLLAVGGVLGLVSLESERRHNYTVITRRHRVNGRRPGLLGRGPGTLIRPFR